MVSGDRCGLNFPDIYLTVEEKPRKKPQPGTDPTGIEPGPVMLKATLLPLEQSGGQVA